MARLPLFVVTKASLFAVGRRGQTDCGVPNSDRTSCIVKPTAEVRIPDSRATNPRQRRSSAPILFPTTPRFDVIVPD
jgi:hypothetical protein